MAQDTAYKQNPLLKQRGVNIDFTKEQVKEVIRCSQDPEYFLSEYIKVISLDDGIIPFHPYPFQQMLPSKVASTWQLLYQQQQVVLRQSSVRCLPYQPIP